MCLTRIDRLFSDLWWRHWGLRHADSRKIDDLANDARVWEERVADYRDRLAEAQASDAGMDKWLAVVKAREWVETARFLSYDRARVRLAEVEERERARQRHEVFEE